MEWTGEGLIIGVRRHGETSVILETMVEGRGRCLGLVRGGRSGRLAPSLQLGNTARLVWRARLDEHLGVFVPEVTVSRAARLMADRERLYLVQLLAEHLRLLPERDPHDDLLAAVMVLLDTADEAALGVDLARFELTLLEDLGFGLDLTSCAATGDTENLTHVSPRSGRAVSREAALPFADRMLRLPDFLVGDAPATRGDVADAFALTGFFLSRHVWEARGILQPSTRDWLVARLTGM